MEGCGQKDTPSEKQEKYGNNCGTPKQIHREKANIDWNLQDVSEDHHTAHASGTTPPCHKSKAGKVVKPLKLGSRACAWRHGSYASSLLL